MRQSDHATLKAETLPMQESMRLLPVDTDGTAIEFPHDIQLAGHTIPA